MTIILSLIAGAIIGGFLVFCCLVVAFMRPWM